MITKLEVLNAFFSNAKWVLRGNELEWLDSIQTEPTEEQIQAKIAELQAAEPLRQLREQRTRILQESDWMANSDVTMSDAWRDYRQALRDLPANSPNVALDEQGNLINVTWPTKPE
jgi:hypothetical protein